MHYLKKSMIPWIVLMGIGIGAFAYSIFNFLAFSFDTIPIAIIMFMIGSFFIGSGAFVIGRISSFLFIEKSARKQRERIKEQSGK
jgi:hypothetical protein